MNTLLDIARALKVSIRGLHEGWRRHPPGRPYHSWLRMPSKLRPQLSMDRGS